MLEECTLPLTGRRCVDRIITDLCVFDVLPEGAGLRLIELAPDVTVEEIEEKTGAAFEVGSGNLALTNHARPDPRQHGRRAAPQVVDARLRSRSASS